MPALGKTSAEKTFSFGHCPKENVFIQKKTGKSASLEQGGRGQRGPKRQTCFHKGKTWPKMAKITMSKSPCLQGAKLPKSGKS